MPTSPLGLPSTHSSLPVEPLPHAKSPSDGLTPARGFGALLGFGVFMLGIAEAFKHVSAQTLLGEGGAIEIAQLMLLALSARLFVAAARFERGGSVFRAIAFLLLLAFVRELDGPLDRVWHGFWKVPALAVAALAVRSLWPDRAKLRSSTLRLARTPSAGLMLAAAAVVLLQSRLLGQQSLWKAVLGDGFISYVPRIVEETSELAGYGLFVLAGLEARRSSRLQAERASSLPTPAHGAVPRPSTVAAPRVAAISA